MKNIHILPTDKPSRLHKTIDKGLFYLKTNYNSSSRWFNQNIYITSDEEIKEGDWFLSLISNEPQKEKEDVSFLDKDLYKKIILTTDDQLIKNGIQSIEDDFLEWFVKNASCKWVDVIKIEDELISHKNPKIRFNALQDPPSFISAESLNNMILTYKYKIIIPKEEQIVETTLEKVAEILKGKELFKESNDRARKVLSEIKSLPIQETLEEAAERVAKGIDSFLWKEIKESMIYFAKCQQEQDNEVIQNLKDRLDMVRHTNIEIIKAVEKLKEQYDSRYSEEEVFNLLMEFSSRDISSSSGTPHSIAKWFEKFKKK